MSTMIATRSVYSVGYSTLGSEEYIDGLMSYPGTLLIDTRFKPYSWDERWRKEELQAKYGHRYRWAGEYLGNLNYQGGPIKLANPAIGIERLVEYLKSHDLILLCQCRAYTKCHVAEVVRLLTEKVRLLTDDIAVDVIHWQPQPQGAALAVQSSSVEVVTAEPPDLAPGCAVCGALATVASPSGRSDSVYCEAHGRCTRCGESVDRFVRHPYVVNYVCPCVIAFDERTRFAEEVKRAKPVEFGF